MLALLALPIILLALLPTTLVCGYRAALMVVKL